MEFGFLKIWGPTTEESSGLLQTDILKVHTVAHKKVFLLFLHPDQNKAPDPFDIPLPPSQPLPHSFLYKDKHRKLINEINIRS